MNGTGRWKTYVWREHLFSVGGVRDRDLLFFAKPLSAYTAAKFQAEEVDEFPRIKAGEKALILRSSHTCLDASFVEWVTYRAETEGKNYSFGAGWAIVNAEPIHLAKYCPIKGAAALLSPVDIPFVTEKIRLEILKSFMRKGVIFESTDGVYVDSTAKLKSGARISHDVTVTGESVIESGAYIKPYTVVEESEVESGAQIGPFVHLRPHSKIGKNCKIGNFTEVKNATLGAGTKAAHLSYIGDAELGEGCNVGCGTVFVNYNGKEKFRSKIGDGCFIGSNVNVVAPVHMSDGSYVAAGSTLTRDLQGGDLCIARARETVYPHRAQNYYPQTKR